MSRGLPNFGDAQAAASADPTKGQAVEKWGTSSLNQSCRDIRSFAILHAPATVYALTACFRLASETLLILVFLGCFPFPLSFFKEAST